MIVMILRFFFLQISMFSYCFFFLHFFVSFFFCLPPPLYVLAWLRSVGLTGAAPVRVQFEAQGAPYLKEYPQGVHQEVNFNQFFKI